VRGVRKNTGAIFQYREEPVRPRVEMDQRPVLMANRLRALAEFDVMR
jgi:hypothetical protein